MGNRKEDIGMAGGVVASGLKGNRVTAAGTGAPNGKATHGNIFVLGIPAQAVAFDKFNHLQHQSGFTGHTVVNGVGITGIQRADQVKYPGAIPVVSTPI